MRVHPFTCLVIPGDGGVLAVVGVGVALLAVVPAHPQRVHPRVLGARAAALFTCSVAWESKHKRSHEKPAVGFNFKACRCSFVRVRA